MITGFEVLVRTDDGERLVRIVGPTQSHLDRANRPGQYALVVKPVLDTIRDKARWELEACGCLRELHDDGRITKLEALAVLKARAIKEV